MTRPPPLSSADLTSLDERLGLLLVLRVGLVVAVIAIALGTPGELAGRPSPVIGASLGYLAVAVAGELASRLRPSTRVALHRFLLPVDVLWLAWVLVPAGGAVRPTVLLLAVELAGVTLLASVRSGIRVALWESAVLLAARLRWLASRLAAARPTDSARASTDIARASTAETTLAVAGLWALVACVGWFSMVSERELRRSKRELAALTSMAAELEAHPSDAEILESLLGALQDAFAVDQVVAVWDDEEQVEVSARPGRGTRATSALLDESATRAGPFQSGWRDEITDELWSSRDPIVLRAASGGTVASLLPEAREMVVLPLGPDGGHRGLVAVAVPDRRLSRRTLAALRQFSSLATLSLRNARLLVERERLAMLDGLTGLANRRSLDRTLTAEVERARRSGEPLSLVVVDIDHFKQVNDVRGHQGGDEVLRVVGRLLAGSVRASDTAARYGGEEFALVLPSCGVGGAMRVAESARSAVSGCAELGGLTLSAGVAVLGPGAADAASLVAAADGALYRSKREGRNRVTVAAPVEEPPPVEERPPVDEPPSGQGLPAAQEPASEPAPAGARVVDLRVGARESESGAD